MYGTLDIRQMMRFEWARISQSFHLYAYEWDRNMILRATKVGGITESKTVFRTTDLDVEEGKCL